MEDETFQHNQDISRLVQLIQNIPAQIENIEHDVSSTRIAVELMATKLEDLLGKLERRDFLDNPSHWQDGAMDKNGASDFRFFP